MCVVEDTVATAEPHKTHQNADDESERGRSASEGAVNEESV